MRTIFLQTEKTLARIEWYFKDIFTKLEYQNYALKHSQIKTEMIQFDQVILEQFNDLKFHSKKYSKIAKKVYL